MPYMTLDLTCCTVRPRQVGLYARHKMKKLTTPATFFVKRVFPVVFGGLAGLMALHFSSQVISISIFLAILIGLAIGILAAMATSHLHSEYMDEVIDYDDRLLVRNRGLEESIDLRDIREVEAAIMSPAGVWLHLRRDSAFGRSIKFLPGASLFGISKLSKSLNARINQAK